MERDDWVVRQPNAKDRRINRIVITDKAKANWAELATQAQDLLGQAYQGIPAKDITTTIKVLTKVRENLDAH